MLRSSSEGVPTPPPGEDPVEHPDAADAADRRPSPEAYEIALSGEIDIAEEPRLRDIAEAYRGSDAARVVVDLAQVTFMDSTGLAFLVTLRNEARARAGSVVLRAPSAKLMRVLTIVAFDRVFEIVD